MEDVFELSGKHLESNFPFLNTLFEFKKKNQNELISKLINVRPLKSRECLKNGIAIKLFLENY